MRIDLVQTLTSAFGDHAQQAEVCIGHCLARDLRRPLGCGEWRNASTAISKDTTARELSNQPIADHIGGVNKMVDLSSRGLREIEDKMLTRYACSGIARRRNCEQTMTDGGKDAIEAGRWLS